MKPASLLPALLLGVMGGLSVLLVQQLVFPRQTIAVVDLQKVIMEQLEAAAKPGESLSEKEIERRAESFARRLDRAVDEIAREYNALLLVSPAVVKGAPDLTARLRERIRKPSSREGDQ